MINVVCVKVRPPGILPGWVNNHGYAYTSEWVNRLKNMVRRNLPLVHAFACITDDPDGLDDDIIPLEAPGLPGWWGKIKAFDPELPLAGRIMVIDLDVLVVGDLTEIVEFPATFAVVRQWKDITSPKTVPMYQMSVCVFDKGARTDAWTKFTPGCIDRFRSDQDWFGHLYPDEKTFPSEWVAGVRDHMSGPPPGAKIMLCMEVNGGKNDKAAEKLDWVRDIWERPGIAT